MTEPTRIPLPADVQAELDKRAGLASSQKRLLHVDMAMVKVVAHDGKRISIKLKTLDRVRMILDRTGCGRECQVWFGDQRLELDRPLADLIVDPEAVFHIRPEGYVPMKERVAEKVGPAVGLWARLVGRVRSAFQRVFKKAP